VITITTTRLVLRPLAPDDADRLFPLFAEWPVIKWLSAPPWPYESAHMQGFIDRSLTETAPDREVMRVIECDGLPIGGIGLRDRGPSHLQSGPGPNVGYWLGARYWGQGYMTEALTALAHHIFTTSDAEAVYSGAFTENAASLRVQIKVGFVRDGATMLRSNPRNIELPHINTKLTRRAFEASSTRNPAP
jgi:RimJ/RimL family protein N-acetyltransferase